MYPKSKLDHAKFGTERKIRYKWTGQSFVKEKIEDNEPWYITEEDSENPAVK